MSYPPSQRVEALSNYGVIMSTSISNLDPHMQLCVNEHIKPTPKPCTECGNESECFAEWCDGSGWICEPCDLKEDD